MTWAIIGRAGAAGALARYELASRIARRAGDRFPWGTLVVNGVGSLLAGILFASDVSTSVALVVGTGFLGGFTTFSTWMLETTRMIDDGPNPRLGLLNLVVMIATGLAGAAIGMS